MLLIAVICITVVAVIQFWRDQLDAGSIDGRDQARLFHPGNTAVRFAQDSLLEEAGFEPSVPGNRDTLFDPPFESFSFHRRSLRSALLRAKVRRERRSQFRGGRKRLPV